MSSTSKKIALKSSDGEVSAVEEPVAVQSEATKNITEDDCAADEGIPIPTPKRITLISSDGEVFEVEEAVAVQSAMIKNIVEDGCADDGIPIPNVTGETLSDVLEYCKKHVYDNASSSDELAKIKAGDEDLAKELKSDQTTLYNLILAANFLNVKGLLDLACQVVADMIKGKMPDEIRKTFNIKNDFTPEEEAEIINENAWAFQKETK